jgi:hypothetical protein
MLDGQPLTDWQIPSEPLVSNPDYGPPRNNAEFAAD